MSYCRLSEAYWNDDAIRALTEPARYFMLYLMSCKHGNRLGLFVLDPGYAASDLDCDDAGWGYEKVVTILGELRDAGRIGWDPQTRMVLVRYYIRHNVLHNKSVIKGALHDLASLPESMLLGDLLDNVIEEQRGEAGPRLVHYSVLEDELRRRCLSAGITWQNGADVEESHGVVHRAVHRAEHGAEDPTGKKVHNGADVEESHGVVHRAGHGAEHGVVHRKRARAHPALPYRTVPVPSTRPNLTHPTQTDRDEHGVGEDVENIDDEIRASLPTARRNIVKIHGSQKAVMIEGHKLGVGIEIEAFKRLCKTGADPPRIIASAIAHLPAVCNLEPPVSLARWTAEDGQPIYEQCVGLAYKSEPTEEAPPLSELEKHFLDKAGRDSGKASA